MSDREVSRQAVSSVLAFEMSDAQRARFWSKVEKSDGCWMWRGYVSPLGYGKFVVNKCNRSVHRISWYLANGPIPDWADICHHCDNPACVNPAHLFAGTARDNILDMERKGRSRHPRGQQNGRNKLSEDDVRRIRNLVASGMTGYRVSQVVGISPGVVWAIHNKRIWRHVE